MKKRKLIILIGSLVLISSIVVALAAFLFHKVVTTTTNTGTIEADEMYFNVYQIDEEADDYTLTEMESKGWYGLYTYNSSLRDGENIILKSLSIYSEMKKKQPKINSWITLILVLSIIGLLYYANIVLNRKLVEKKGYDIKQIKRKYRPFIKNS